MSIRAILIVVLAVICGLSAAFGVNQLGKSSTVEVKSPTVDIVVIKVAANRGQTLTKDHLEIAQRTKGQLPPGVITKLADAVDRVANTQLVVGEPLMDAKLASKGAGRGLDALIPKGMRAFTIMTSRVNSNVAGFVLPGNRVDILLNMGNVTTTLLQSVEILACGQQLDAPAENKMNMSSSSVTLQVTPQNAKILDLAGKAGQLTLSLRNPDGGTEDDDDSDPVTMAYLLYLQNGSPTDDETAPAEEESEVPEDIPPLKWFRGTRQGYIRFG